MSIRVIEEKCVGCGLCSRKCPQSAITVVNKKASIDESKCIVCKLCVNTCRFNAIEVVGQKQENSEKSSYKGIAVYAESIDGKTRMCPKCGARLKIKKSKPNNYYKCSNTRECDFTEIIINDK